MGAHDLLSNASTTAEIHAAQLYCTAVVENERDVGNMPRASEYMAMVKGIKKPGEAVENLEAAAKSD